MQMRTLSSFSLKKRRLKGNLINLYKYWTRGSKEHRARNTGNTEIQEIQFKHKIKLICCECGQTLEQFAQRGCGGTIPGDIQNPSMLIFAGIELIFFIGASMRICFGFVLKTVLIMQRCFRYHWAVLTQSQGLFCFSHHTPPASRLGVHKKLGGDTARTADPTDQREIPCHMMSCSAYKAKGRRRKGDIKSDGTCLPK